MNKGYTLTALIFWLFFTFLLVISVIGILVLIPQINATDYYKPQEDLRSSWMRIGVALMKKLVE